MKNPDSATVKILEKFTIKHRSIPKSFFTDQKKKKKKIIAIILAVI